MALRLALMTVSVAGLSVGIAHGEQKDVVDCHVKRIVASLDEVDGQTTLAASFTYGEYVEGAEDRMAMLSSRTLGPKFEALPEAQRWLHPEYVLIRDFMARKEGDLEKLLTCYPEGPEREGIRTKGIAGDKELIEQMNLREVLFLYKAYYGPYVVIFSAFHEMPDDPEVKGRAMPGWIYLKRFEDRYLRVEEIDGRPAMSHPFVQVLINYGGRKVLGKETIAHSLNTSQMSWVAFDTNMQPSNGDETLRAFSPGTQPSPLQIPSSFSDNHVVIYYRLQPVGVALKAGQHKPDLSPKLRFIESAVTASALGTEQEIAQYWPEDCSYLRNIQNLKDAGQWPEVRRSPWGDKPTILALLPTSGGTLVLFDRSSGNVWTLALIEAENDKDGPHWLLSEHLPMGSHLNSISHLFRHSSLMRDAFAEQYKACIEPDNGS